MMKKREAHWLELGGRKKKYFSVKMRGWGPQKNRETNQGQTKRPVRIGGEKTNPGAA